MFGKTHIIFGIFVVSAMWACDGTYTKKTTVPDRGRADEAAAFVERNPTINNLRQFTVNYPKHPFAGMAGLLIDSILTQQREDSLWAKILENPFEEEQLRVFETDFPNSRHIDEVRSQLQQARLESLSEQLSAKGLRQYLSNYAEAGNELQLCRELDEWCWRDARLSNTAYFYSRYLESLDGVCPARYKGAALDSLDHIARRVLRSEVLARRTFSGTYRHDEQHYPLLVQFSRDDEKRLVASVNLGNQRFRNLGVRIDNGMFTLSKKGDHREFEFLKGYLYRGEEGLFIESAYSVQQLYWKAENYAL